MAVPPTLQSGRPAMHAVHSPAASAGRGGGLSLCRGPGEEGGGRAAHVLGRGGGAPSWAGGGGRGAEAPADAHPGSAQLGQGA